MYGEYKSDWKRPNHRTFKVPFFCNRIKFLATSHYDGTNMSHCIIFVNLDHEISISNAIRLIRRQDRLKQNSAIIKDVEVDSVVVNPGGIDDARAFADYVKF